MQQFESAACLNILRFFKRGPTMSSAEQEGSEPPEATTPAEPVNQQLSVARRDNPLVATRGIPENPWLDDVGMLKDKKAHFALDRAVACHCEGCMRKATSIVNTTYTKSFNKEMPEMTPGVVFNIYETIIQKVRNAKREIPSVTVFEFPKQPPGPGPIGPRKPGPKI